MQRAQDWLQLFCRSLDAPCTGHNIRFWRKIAACPSCVFQTSALTCCSCEWDFQVLCAASWSREKPYRKISQYLVLPAPSACWCETGNVQSSWEHLQYHLGFVFDFCVDCSMNFWVGKKVLSLFSKLLCCFACYLLRKQVCPLIQDFGLSCWLLWIPGS